MRGANLKRAKRAALCSAIGNETVLTALLDVPVIDADHRYKPFDVLIDYVSSEEEPEGDGPSHRRGAPGKSNEEFPPSRTCAASSVSLSGARSPAPQLPHSLSHGGVKRQRSEEAVVKKEEVAATVKHEDTTIEDLSISHKYHWPMRVGWAQRRLNVRAPYQTFAVPGVLDTFQYALDEEEWTWCAAHHVDDTQTYTAMITALERSYCKHIVDVLRSATPEGSKLGFSDSCDGILEATPGPRDASSGGAASDSGRAVSAVTTVSTATSGTSTRGGKDAEGASRSGPAINSKSRDSKRILKDAPMAMAKDGVIMISLPLGTPPPLSVTSADQKPPIVIIKRGRGRPPTNPASIAAAAARAAEAARVAQLAAERAKKNRSHSLNKSSEDASSGAQTIIVHSNLAFASGNKARLEFVTTSPTDSATLTARMTAGAADGHMAGRSGETDSASLLPTQWVPLAKSAEPLVQEAPPVLVPFCGVCGESLPQNDPHALQCTECFQRAHYQCWMFTAAPPAAEGGDHAKAADSLWVCDVCSSGPKKTKAIHCAACNRSGGVMLPTVGTASVRPPYPFCHIICAAMFPELTIDAERRTVMFNNRIDRRRYQLHCAYCDRYDGACTQCRQPHCYEAMHPYCAVLARTVEVRRQAGTEGGRAGMTGGSPTATSPGTLVDVNNIGYNAFCRDHYTDVVEVPDELGSSDFVLLSEQAEQVALRALTETLSTRRLSSPRESRVGKFPIRYPWEDDDANETLHAALLRAPVRYMKLVADHWRELREAQYARSMRVAELVNSGELPMAQAMYHRALMKVSATHVRVARFISLIPELQRCLVASVEGVLPLKDEEEDLENFIKNNTRNSGNSVKLYRRMEAVAESLKLLLQLSKSVADRVLTENELIDVELELIGYDDGG